MFYWTYIMVKQNTKGEERIKNRQRFDRNKVSLLVTCVVAGYFLRPSITAMQLTRNMVSEDDDEWRYTVANVLSQ